MRSSDWVGVICGVLLLLCAIDSFYEWRQNDYPKTSLRKVLGGLGEVLGGLAIFGAVKTALVAAFLASFWLGDLILRAAGVSTDYTLFFGWLPIFGLGLVFGSISGVQRLLARKRRRDAAEWRRRRGLPSQAETAAFVRQVFEDAGRK